MPISKLKVQLRNSGGKSASNKLRKEGFIPAVVYGHNKETKSIKIDESMMEKLLNKYGQRGTVNMELDGEVVPVIIKDIQRHTIKDNLLHIDFQQLSDNEKIKIQVPIYLAGKEKVKSSKTILQQQLMELDIQCLPKYIPQSFELDVSNLKYGEALLVEDMDVLNDENIDVLNELSEVVVSLTSTTSDEISEDTDEPIYESDKSILE
ncbi:50S ribosomal protein L25 [Dethiothermospora halolimnae]|uniref:50S ribosomal protein L25 n=1 Tax=Dethiothermospora halolimnae TaxID=3114390 RepID=UPI003CCC3824